MDRRYKGASVSQQAHPETPKPTLPESQTDDLPAAEQVRARRVVLPADWLPIALLVGDAIIAALSIPFGYWVRYVNADQTLAFGPYLAAIPVVVILYVVALATNRQYSSWRGRTLVDQLLSLYYGIGFAAVLMLAAIELANLGQRYSRLTLIPPTH